MPPERMGMACGAKVPSTPVLSGGSCASADVAANAAMRAMNARCMSLSPILKRWATIFLASTRRTAIVTAISQEVSMLNESARGVYIISVTPFDERGALDLDGTDRLIDFYLRCGVDGITILGVMGEAPKLSHDEAVTFTRRVIA